MIRCPASRLVRDEAACARGGGGLCETKRQLVRELAVCGDEIACVMRRLAFKRTTSCQGGLVYEEMVAGNAVERGRAELLCFIECQ